MPRLYGPDNKILRLHDKHDVNPTVSVCFFCRNDKKEVVLLGAAFKGKAPHRMILDKVPCDKCKEYMEKGIMFIETKDGEGGDNPERTGRLWVVTEESISKFLKPDKVADLVKKRVVFVSEMATKALGLHDLPMPTPPPSP